MKDRLEKDEFVHEVFEKLHHMPELGFEEVKTSEYLVDQLENLGYKVTRNVGTTGVIGVLESGKPGTTFALRGDIDALPFKVEGEDRAFHACGHDANSSMVLTAAKRAAERGIKKGRFAVVFQQAEEKMGAIEMAKTGKMDFIDEMVGIHLRPEHEAALGEAISGLCGSAARFIKIKVRGRSAHAARPHLGVSALDTVVAIINMANTIWENSLSPHSLKATKIKTIGNPSNTIPDLCEVTFDLRAEDNNVAENILDKLKKISENTADSYGASIEEFSHEGVLAAELDEDLTELCDKAIKSILGKSLGIRKSPGGEDIHYFKKMCGIKIGYIGIGADMKGGLHKADMEFDKRALDIGSDILEKIIDLKLGLN